MHTSTVWYGHHPWFLAPMSFPALRQDTEGLSRRVLNTLVRARLLIVFNYFVYMYGDLQLAFLQVL